MKSHKFNGEIRAYGHEICLEFSTMIHTSGYFYARSERQYGLDQIQIFIHPFTPRMLTEDLISSDVNLHYEFRGNSLGRVRYGSDNADGAWKTWKLNQVSICVNRYNNGINIKFDVGTDRGAWTTQGGIDSKTERTLDPFNYDFELFIPIDRLKDFLTGEHESWVDPRTFIDKFISKLNESGLNKFNNS